MFYNPYNISKDGIHITRRDSVTSEYCGLLCRAICTGYSIYTGPSRVTTPTVAPTKGPVQKNNIKFHYQKYSMKITP